MQLMKCLKLALIRPLIACQWRFATAMSNLSGKVLASPFLKVGRWIIYFLSSLH